MQDKSMENKLLNPAGTQEVDGRKHKGVLQKFGTPLVKRDRQRVDRSGRMHTDTKFMTTMSDGDEEEKKDDMDNVFMDNDVTEESK